MILQVVQMIAVICLAHNCSPELQTKCQSYFAKCLSEKATSKRKDANLWSDLDMAQCMRERP